MSEGGVGAVGSTVDCPLWAALSWAQVISEGKIKCSMEILPSLGFWLGLPRGLVIYIDANTARSGQLTMLLWVCDALYNVVVSTSTLSSSSPKEKGHEEQRNFSSIGQHVENPPKELSAQSVSKSCNNLYLLVGPYGRDVLLE